MGQLLSNGNVRSLSSRNSLWTASAVYSQGPRSSGDRASPSGGVCAGSNPAEGTTICGRIDPQDFLLDARSICDAPPPTAHSRNRSKACPIERHRSTCHMCHQLCGAELCCGSEKQGFGGYGFGHHNSPSWNRDWDSGGCSAHYLSCFWRCELQRQLWRPTLGWPLP